MEQTKQTRNRRVTSGQWQAWLNAHRPHTACQLCRDEAGTYDHQRCFDCAVRLIVSARPSRAAQEAMLAVVEKTHGRERLIQAVKDVPSRHPSGEN